MQINRLVKGYVYAGLTVLIWSGFILISRLGGASPLTPYDITALRFGTAGMLLLPVFLWKTSIRIFDYRMLLLTAFGGIAYALFVYTGFKHAPATHAAILLPGLLPFEIAFFVWLLTSERLIRMQVLGLVFILAGICFLAVDTVVAGLATLQGDILFFLSSLSWAIYTVLIRRWSVTVWEATIGTTLLAALLYLPVYCLFLPKAMGSASWAIISIQAVYQGVFAVIIAMYFYLSAVSIIGATKTGTLMAAIPGISGFAAALFLHEPVSIILASGLVLVCVGAWIGSKSQLPDQGGKHAKRE